MFPRAVVILSWLWLIAACGPPELPAFANPPPPPDAGADADDAGD